MKLPLLQDFFGVKIPSFAYLIVFTAMANIFNLLPDHLKQGAKKCQQFCSGKLVWFVGFYPGSPENCKTHYGRYCIRSQIISPKESPSGVSDRKETLFAQ